MSDSRYISIRNMSTAFRSVGVEPLAYCVCMYVCMYVCMHVLSIVQYSITINMYGTGEEEGEEAAPRRRQKSKIIGNKPLVWASSSLGLAQEWSTPSTPPTAVHIDSSYSILLYYLQLQHSQYCTNWLVLLLTTVPDMN